MTCCWSWPAAAWRGAPGAARRAGPADGELFEQRPDRALLGAGLAGGAGRDAAIGPDRSRLPQVPRRPGGPRQLRRWAHRGPRRVSAAGSYAFARSARGPNLAADADG